MKVRGKLAGAVLALVALCALLALPGWAAEGAPGVNTTTVLFTHDLHSHFLP